MDILYCLIVILILAITAVVLNEEVKISPILNNYLTRAVILIAAVYIGLKQRDIPMAVLISILFVVLTNDHIQTKVESFDEQMPQDEPTEMMLDLTYASNKQKCLAKCVSSDNETNLCKDYCDNSCFLKCSSNDQNSLWSSCKDICQ